VAQLAEPVEGPEGILRAVFFCGIQCAAHRRVNRFGVLPGDRAVSNRAFGDERTVEEGIAGLDKRRKIDLDGRSAQFPERRQRACVLAFRQSVAEEFELLFARNGKAKAPLPLRSAQRQQTPPAGKKDRGDRSRRSRPGRHRRRKGSAPRLERCRSLGCRKENRDC